MESMPPLPNKGYLEGKESQTLWRLLLEWKLNLRFFPFSFGSWRNSAQNFLCSLLILSFVILAPFSIFHEIDPWFIFIFYFKYKEFFFLTDEWKSAVVRLRDSPLYVGGGIYCLKGCGVDVNMDRGDWCVYSFVPTGLARAIAYHDFVLKLGCSHVPLSDICSLPWSGFLGFVFSFSFFQLSMQAKGYRVGPVYDDVLAMAWFFLELIVKSMALEQTRLLYNTLPLGRCKCKKSFLYLSGLFFGLIV